MGDCTEELYNIIFIISSFLMLFKFLDTKYAIFLALAIITSIYNQKVTFSLTTIRFRIFLIFERILYLFYTRTRRDNTYQHLTKDYYSLSTLHFTRLLRSDRSISLSSLPTIAANIFISYAYSKIFT